MNDRTCQSRGRVKRMQIREEDYLDLKIRYRDVVRDNNSLGVRIKKELYKVEIAVSTLTALSAGKCLSEHDGVTCWDKDAPVDVCYRCVALDALNEITSITAPENGGAYKEKPNERNGNEADPEGIGSTGEGDSGSDGCHCRDSIPVGEGETPYRFENGEIIPSRCNGQGTG